VCSSDLALNLVPDTDVFAALKAARIANPRQEFATALGAWLPKRLAQLLAGEDAMGRLADLNDSRLRATADLVRNWRLVPVGSEGYRTAEVTLGGVDTDDLSSQTLAAKAVPGLYFIGEVVDVTGHLGGFNFQWAWASAQAAGKALHKAA
jgi:predicted flavoprotein YhiN